MAKLGQESWSCSVEKVAKKERGQGYEIRGHKYVLFFICKFATIPFTYVLSKFTEILSIVLAKGGGGISLHT